MRNKKLSLSSLVHLILYDEYGHVSEKEILETCLTLVNAAQKPATLRAMRKITYDAYIGEGEVKYLVDPNHCKCHPETCTCQPWVITRNGRRFLNLESKAIAEMIATALNNMG